MMPDNYAAYGFSRALAIHQQNKSAILFLFLRYLQNLALLTTPLA
jgi:hypothetical protein